MLEPRAILEPLGVAFHSGWRNGEDEADELDMEYELDLVSLDQSGSENQCDTV